MLRRTVLSAAMLLARTDVKESTNRGHVAFTMKVDGVNQPNFKALIVKEEENGEQFFSILAFQKGAEPLNLQPSVWLSVNAGGKGTYAIQRRLNHEGAWALYNDAEGAGFSFFNTDPKQNKGFVSTCGAITISEIDEEHRRISGRFRFNAVNGNGIEKNISEGSFSNLSYYEHAS